jgi:prepilin-type N-terminal cleavage/methylation domain-containing protein
LKGGKNSQQALSKTMKRATKLKLEPNLFMGVIDMKKSTKKNKKGFTLIELLIVVAIIAILAAISIPQFSQYRIKGYNAAASSDIRNAKTAEEALFADFQAYGDTNGIYGTLARPAPAIITTSDVNGNARILQASLSNGVQLVARTGDATGAAVAVGGAGANYAIFTKHFQGDRTFMADGNAPTMYWLPAASGANLVDPACPSTNGNDITASGAATPL